MRGACRVLHVTDYAASYEGAFIRQLRMLDEELRERGCSPSALAVPADALDHPWAATLRSEGWSLHGLPACSTRVTRRASGAVEQVIRDVEPSLVHVHFGTWDLSVRHALQRVWADTRDSRADAHDPLLVWHYRTALETTIEQRSLPRRIKDYLKYARAGRDVDQFVAVTDALADEVVRRGAPADRSRAVRAGTDTDQLCADPGRRTAIRHQLGVGDDDVLLLHMGWKWYRKGGDLLARALEELADVEPRIVACSIGAPEDVDTGAVRRLERTDRVHELHQAADIFISASRSEGFGNGLMEAMSCERVAVAAAAHGQRETFDGVPGVEVVDADDAHALAVGIRALIARRDTWPEAGRANRAHVVARHSMRRWAGEMADTYAVLLPERVVTRAALDAARDFTTGEVA